MPETYDPQCYYLAEHFCARGASEELLDAVASAIQITAQEDSRCAYESLETSPGACDGGDLCGADAIGLKNSRPYCQKHLEAV